MNGFLLDTNVLSCLAPDKPAISAPARKWFTDEANAGRLFLSAMTFLEIEQGLRSLARRGAVVRYQALLDWLEAVDEGYRERVLPMNATVARLAGAMSEAAKAEGVHPGLPDIIIAATARAHGLTVVTLNRKHFHRLGFTEDLPPALRSLRDSVDEH
ncbi:type II toxin-antitoxin system VapC family toxin [Rhizobium sp. SG2393]|uniref:type II toxin-antitoxin system VapC family toxin n=1 Tax=Rhizobium sp. SG2393 TaxID=3276279 RepID=UPI0036702F67